MSRRQKDLFPDLPDGKKYVSDIPKLMAEWHPTKNKGLNPEDVTHGSNKKAWWLCAKGHEWEATIGSRPKNGCPYCSNLYVSKGSSLYDLNPTVCDEWDYEKNQKSPFEYTPNSSAVVYWRCNHGEDHRWKARIGSRTKPNDGLRNGCPYCTGRKPSIDYNLGILYPRLLEEWHPTLNKKTPFDYTPSSNYKVWWKCSKGHEWEAAINNRSAGRNCPTCSNKSSRNEIRLLTELKALFGDVLSRHKLGKHEVDIFLPEFGVGIEYDGWWWHRDSFEKDQRKQQDVTNAGFQLIRVRETPLPKITSADIYVDGVATITKLDVASVIKLISERHYTDYTVSDDFLNDDLYRVYLDYFPSPFPEHSMAQQNPKLAAEWHPTKNKPLTPYNFAPKASFRAWWQCSQGHDWEATINNRSSNNRNCPYCAGRYATAENCMSVTNPELAAIFHPTKNGRITPTNIKSTSGKILWWQCEKGHEWQQRAYAVAKNTSEVCPQCRFPSMAETNPEMAAAFHPTLNGQTTPYDISAGTRKRLWFQCANDTAHIWQSTGDNLKRVSRPELCPECRRKQK